MKLSRTSAYAVAVLVQLARGKSGGPVSARLMVAANPRLPPAYLGKIMAALSRAGILRSVRGPSGGAWLTRPPKDVTLLEVVEAVDGPVRGDVPLVGKDGAAAHDKRLQAVCDEAAGLVRERLGKVTLAELAKAK